MVKKVMYWVVKILFFIFVALFLVYLFREARSYGYQIFADEAKDDPESAVEVVLTIEEGESVLEIGKDLARRDVVENAYIFAVSLRCMEDYGKIQPGEYVVDSSMKPSEILETIIQKEET